MKIKILVIDDDLSFIYALKWLFHKKKFIFKWSKTKKEGLLLLDSYKPDIVILDLNLNPYVFDITDAVEILEYTKKKSKSKIIISTVEHNDSIRKKLLALGADDYLIKPYTPEKLINIVSRIEML